MKNLLALLGLCCCLLSLSAWAQPGYLIKIDEVNQATVDQIKNTGIEVYAKTADFWVAAASKGDIEFLTKEKIPFQIFFHSSLIRDP